MKNLVPFNENAFLTTSVTRQIQMIHEWFTALAKLPTWSPATEQEIDTVMRIAAKASEKLKASGKDEESPLYHGFVLWILFLNMPKAAVYHAAFLRKLFKELHLRYPKANFCIRVYPFTSFLYKVSIGRDETMIDLHECFIGITDSEIEAFTDYIVLERLNDIGNILKPILRRKEMLTIQEFFSRETVSRQKEADPVGQYLNLNDSFNRVNAAYFGSKMLRPTLCWSANSNRTLMGSYNEKTDILMVNRLLDKKKTPQYVLDFIMYHEMLHKALGIQTKNGRRLSHTPEFREYERMFAQFQEAETYLKKLPR